MFEVAKAIIAAKGRRSLKKPRYQLVQTWFPKVISPQRLVSYFHDQGLELHFWTVNKPGTIKKALDAAPDGIITNFPGRVYQELMDRGLRPRI